MNPGILIGMGAFTLWGLLPLFWKLLQGTPAEEILAHRMVWSLLFFLILIAITKSWKGFQEIKNSPKILIQYGASGILISFNWFIYIWSVLNGYVVEASLGYFINPLVAVLLSVIFLKERLRPAQIGAISLAFIGVLYLTFIYGRLPWRGLILAFSFSFYGLVKKGVKLPSIHGMAVETGFQFIPALSFLLYLGLNSKGSFTLTQPNYVLLFILSGAVTGLPLLMFSIAARKISLSQLGILQYIAPSLQLFIGVLVYNEEFPQNKLIGFCLIWLAVIIYTTENVMNYRRKKRVPAS